MGARRTLLFFAMLISFCPLRLLGADAPTGLLGELEEHFQREVLVSGDIVVGIVRRIPRLALDSPISLQMLVVPTEDVRQQTACVEVLSRDGRYSAEASYELPAVNATAWVTLPYPSQYRDWLLALGPDDVAVIAHARRCGESEVDRASIAAWPSSEKGVEGQVVIFVNSAYSDRVWITADLNRLPDDGARHNCQKIQSGTSVAFDYVCVIPDTEGTELSCVTVTRERRGNPRQPNRICFDGNDE